MFLLAICILGMTDLTGVLPNFQGQPAKLPVLLPNNGFVLGYGNNLVVFNGKQHNIKLNVGIRAMRLHNNRLVVATAENTHVYDIENLTLLGQGPGAYTLVSLADRLFYTQIAPPKGIAFPALLNEFDPISLETRAEHNFFKKPDQFWIYGQCWAVQRGDDRFLIWSNEPHHVYYTNQRLMSKDQGISIHYPGISPTIPLWPAEDVKKEIVWSEDFPVSQIQELLARRNITYFGALGDGYILVTEVGVLAPGLLNRRLYIGSKLELLILDSAFKEVDRLNAEGIFMGMENNNAVFLHNLDGSYNPRALYEAVEGTPFERTRTILKKFKGGGEATYSVDLHRVDLSSYLTELVHNN